MNESLVVLMFDEALPADPKTGKVPHEQYSIVVKGTGEKAGAIRLRLSNADEIRLYAGHIGYRIGETYRGHRYAAYACIALKPIAMQYGFSELWITCDTDNWPSRRTCEHIGAELVEIIDLPEDLDMYLDGERQKCRYRWQLD